MRVRRFRVIHISTFEDDFTIECKSTIDVSQISMNSENGILKNMMDETKDDQRGIDAKKARYKVIGSHSQNSANIVVGRLVLNDQAIRKQEGTEQKEGRYAEFFAQ
jgi:hypothetical protein